MALQQGSSNAYGYREQDYGCTELPTREITKASRLALLLLRSELDRRSRRLLRGAAREVLADARFVGLAFPLVTLRGRLGLVPEVRAEPGCSVLLARGLLLGPLALRLLRLIPPGKLLGEPLLEVLERILQTVCQP